MQSSALTPDAYLQELPEERRDVVERLRKVIRDNLPPGFEETMGYGMLAFVVPHSVYPAGYHCDPKIPLPFISVASQKNYVALYHMGIYTDPDLMEWFTAEYARRCRSTLDMGKSCIRFKNLEGIPYDLVGELAARMTVDDWIGIYERQIRK